MKVTPRFLDGVVLAANAVQGGVVVVDAHRCELEREAMLDSAHDWYAQSMGAGPYSRDRKVFAPSWAHSKMVTGTEEALREEIQTASSRYPGAPILVCRSALSLLISADTQGVIDEVSESTSNPLLLLERESLEDDWIDGWRQAHQAMLGYATGSRGAGEPFVSGYCMFRREGDELGNLAEIQRLWQECGLAPCAWFFDGRPIKKDSVAPSAPRVAFPFDSSPGPDGALRVGMPIGIENTIGFLRALTGISPRPDEVERLIGEECARIKPRLQPFVVNALAGRGAVVVGDPWTAPALAAALQEFSIETTDLVILRKSSAGDYDLTALEQASDRVWIDPLYADVQDRLAELSSKRLCDVVVGSGMLNDAAKRAGLACVEISAPHSLEHFASETPYMGFAGCLRLAERLANAIMRSEYY
jgi:nitrogenase molybdenum-iron protein alpha/beta subunit